MSPSEDLERYPFRLGTRSHLKIDFGTPLRNTQPRTDQDGVVSLTPEQMKSVENDPLINWGVVFAALAGRAARHLDYVLNVFFPSLVPGSQPYALYRAFEVAAEDSRSREPLSVVSSTTPLFSADAVSAPGALQDNPPA